MVVAPHPDDEALACGVILQRAVQSSAAIKVVYATDGQNNPWPQRALQRKWRLRKSDCDRWGRLRRAEALAALRVLCSNRASAQFLRWPDQGITRLARQCRRELCEELQASIESWAPTLLLVPSVRDTHADHSAVGKLMGSVYDEVASARPTLAVWSYQVHGRKPPRSDRHCVALSPTVCERATKLRAIRCHKTQIALSKKRFCRYAERPEHFVQLQVAAAREFEFGSRAPSWGMTVIHPRLALASSPNVSAFRENTESRQSGFAIERTIAAAERRELSSCLQIAAPELD